MSKIATTLALCATLLALGCDDGRGGGTDAGGIVLMDSGPGMMGTDAGPGMMGTDAGTGMMGTCSVAGATGFPPLPAGCLPRCTMATASAVQACTTVECQTSALMADTTAPTNLDTGSGTESINCFGCFNWMANACVFDSCPTELSACAMCADACNADTAGCETEEGALDTCLTTNMTAFQSCFNMRASQCFDL